MLPTCFDRSCGHPQVHTEGYITKRLNHYINVRYNVFKYLCTWM